MNVIELTKKMISLPSYDDGNLYEKPMSDFLFGYVKKYLPWLTVTLQEVAKNRCNIFLTDSGKTRLLVVDQIDTVVPESGWQTNALCPVKSEGKLYGLGASDSKGNVAAFLKALEAYGPTAGLAVLLYVDEEYFFAGMKAFVASDAARRIRPEWILSIDGNGSSLGDGCRGLVEFDVEVRSPSGHSANPSTRGALKPLLSALASCERWVRTLRDEQQGTPSLNLALLQSGLLLEERGSELVLAQVGNRIPSIARAKIEVRTTSAIDAFDIRSFISRRLAMTTELTSSFTPIFDLPGFSTSRMQLYPVITAIEDVMGQTRWLDPSTFGYLDCAMLAREYPEARICSFGIGEPGTTHRCNEYVLISRLEEGVRVYLQILKTLLA